MTVGKVLPHMAASTNIAACLTSMIVWNHLLAVSKIFEGDLISLFSSHVFSGLKGWAFALCCR